MQQKSIEIIKNGGDKTLRKYILKSGAATVDITPKKSMFLFGYPHMERYSEGTHDPIYASALVLDNGNTQIVFCVADIIFIGKDQAEEVRKLVNQKTGIPKENIVISASHTHSGPLTVNMASNKNDPAVPSASNEYTKFLINTLSNLINKAYCRRIESELAILTISGEGVGGNRRIKGGITDPEVPVIVVRRKKDKEIFAVSTTYCMHPTVLHEDSKLYSADFPGYTREYILKKLGKNIVYLYHTGPEGNQSPRHFIKGTTFDEAKRLGYMLGERIVKSISGLTDIDFKSSVSLKASVSRITLPLKQFPSVKEADRKLKKALQKLEQLKKKNASYAEIRTAECDWFGAEETTTIANLAANDELKEITKTILPAEIQVFEINDNYFVNIPGEYFVEYSLSIKEKSPYKTFVTCLANGELQGYIVTKEAYIEGGYEASNSLFSTEAGDVIIKETIKLIKNRT